MENNNLIGGARGGIGERTRSRNHVVEEFVPSSAWTEDSNGHYLLVDLPEFKKEEVKLQVDNSSHITVSGERLVANNNKCIYFDQKFKIPENSDIDEITGKFDGEILYVTVPKLENDQHSPSTHENINNSQIATDHHQEKHVDHHQEKHVDHHGADHDHDHHLHKEKIKRGDSDPVQRSPYLEKALELIRRNKGILVTAVIAFFIGVLVTRSKFESPGGDGMN